jgi:hypothetical protein
MSLATLHFLLCKLSRKYRLSRRYAEDKLLQRFEVRSHGDEDVDVGLLGCDAGWTCRWTPAYLVHTASIFSPRQDVGRDLPLRRNISREVTV